MRIGLFTDTYCPQLNGVATSIYMLSTYLRARGDQVFIFTTTDPAAPKDEEHVFRIPSLPVLKDRRIGMFYHLGIARQVKRLGLDLIHTHTEFCLGVFGRFLARELGLPMVHTYHTIYEDYTHYLTKRKMLESLAKRFARKISTDFCNSADQVIVPTDKVKDILLSYGVHTEVEPIPTGIELGRFAPGLYSREDIQRARQALGIGDGERVLLYLGRMAEEKNIAELLAHLHPYLQGAEGLRFLLVGDGADRQRLQDIADDLGMQDKVIFAGAKPYGEIGLYYQAGDVFVNASQSEAQGLTYIEAMAAGLPVVAKADRCLEGILQDGVNGYAFTDQDGLLKAVDRLLRDDVERENLRRGALQTADRFSAEMFANRVSGVYQSMIDLFKRQMAS